MDKKFRKDYAKLKSKISFDILMCFYRKLVFRSEISKTYLKGGHIFIDDIDHNMVITRIITS